MMMMSVKMNTLIPDLTEGAKSMTVSEDSEKNEKQRMDLFYAYLKQRASSGDVDTNRAVTEILHEADRSVMLLI